MTKKFKLYLLVSIFSLHSSFPSLAMDDDDKELKNHIVNVNKDKINKYKTKISNRQLEINKNQEQINKYTNKIKFLVDMENLLNKFPEVSISDSERIQNPTPITPNLSNKQEEAFLEPSPIFIQNTPTLNSADNREEERSNFLHESNWNVSQAKGNPHTKYKNHHIIIVADKFNPGKYSISIDKNFKIVPGLHKSINEAKLAVFNYFYPPVVQGAHSIQPKPKLSLLGSIKNPKADD